MYACPSVNALQCMDIFAGVKPEILARLVTLSTSKEIPCGEFFVVEGELADSFFALESGQAAVLKSWQGKQFVLDHLQAGSCFGEIGMLDLSPRMASILAVERSRAIEVPSAALFQIFEDDPEQFAIIQMNLARTVSRRFRQASERLFDTRMRAARLAHARQ